MKKFVRLLGVVMTLCLSLSACGSSSTTETASTASTSTTTAESAEQATEETGLPGTYRVALVAPMTGDSAQYGLMFQRGVETYVEEYNALGGMQVEVVSYDDKNDAKEAVNIANLILSDGEFDAIIGPFSTTCAFAMGEVLDEEEMLTFSPSVSHADYVVDFDYTMRLAPVSTGEGVFAAKYAKQYLAGSVVGCIYINNDYGIGVNDAFVEECEAQGMTVAVNDPYISGQTKDFSSMFTKMKEAGVDVVYLSANYTEAGAMLQQLAQIELDAEVMVASTAYKVETLEVAGSTADNAYFLGTFAVDNTDPLLVEFRAKIREKYDVEIDNFITRAYDVAMILTDAVEATNGDTSAQAMIDAMLNMGVIHGVNGENSFGEDRNVIRTYLISGTDGNGGFQFIEAPAVD